MPHPSTPLVLLHAAGRGPAMWRPQVELFSTDFRVLTPSLGDTDLDAGFSVPVAADRIGTAIAEDPAGRAMVCGISLGAMVALQLAVDHPERVSALILSGGQARPNRALLAVNYALLNLLPKRAIVFDGGSRRALLNSYRSLFGWGLLGRLGEVHAPTLVLCGGRDRANLSAARQLAVGIAGARLEVVPGAGHLWNVSDADRFSAVVGDFCRQLPGLGGGR